MQQTKTAPSTESAKQAIQQAKELLEKDGYTPERLSKIELDQDDPLYTAMRQAKQTKNFNFA